MEILNQFGFDIQLFVAQIVNFLIIAFIFKRFMYKPLLSAIKKREEKISKGLKDAENAQKALEEAQVRSEEIVLKASREADKILQTTKQEAENIRTELVQKATLDTEKMITAAKEQIELEREKFKKESKNLALTLANKILEGSLKGLFDKNEQEQIIKKGLQKIKLHE